MQKRMTNVLSMCKGGLAQYMIASCMAGLRPQVKPGLRSDEEAMRKCRCRHRCVRSGEQVDGLLSGRTAPERHVVCKVMCHANAGTSGDASGEGSKQTHGFFSRTKEKVKRWKNRTFVQQEANKAAQKRYRSTPNICNSFDK